MSKRADENPRAFVPEPMPLAEAVEIPLPIHSGGMLRALSFLLQHQMRTMTYVVPVLGATLYLHPKQTVIALGVYWGGLAACGARVAGVGILERTPASELHAAEGLRPLQAVHRGHPPSRLHGREHGPESKTRGIMGVLPGMGPVWMCVAPAARWYPLWVETGGKYITDASAKTVRKILTKGGESVLLLPGGFSEAVYIGASKGYDHAYLAGRVGFLKLAIERGIDVAPVYGFGLASAYSGLHMFEGSQHTGEPSCAKPPGYRACCPSGSSAARSPTTKATSPRCWTRSQRASTVSISSSSAHRTTLPTSSVASTHTRAAKLQRPTKSFSS